MTQEISRYNRNYDRVHEYLGENDLVQFHDLPLSTTVGNVYAIVVKGMEESSHKYSLTTPPGGGSALQLLSLVAKGQRRASDQCIRLRPEFIGTEVTLQEVVSRPNQWKFQGIQGLNIVNGRLQLWIRKSPLMCSNSQLTVPLVVDQHPLRHIENNRVHSCAGPRFWSLFWTDRAPSSAAPSSVELYDNEDGTLGLNHHISLEI